ncbi:MAG: hypothetical protein HYW26_04955 [Candidatus Aenigmarchaeota archaeon]|nr:hypothetical protein [Candidatus Aenigmarchaeota archaeon]
MNERLTGVHRPVELHRILKRAPEGMKPGRFYPVEVDKRYFLYRISGNKLEVYEIVRL